MKNTNQGQEQPKKVDTPKEPAKPVKQEPIKQKDVPQRRYLPETHEPGKGNPLHD